MKRRYISIAIGLIIVIAITIFGNICKIDNVEIKFAKEPVSVDSVEIFGNSNIELGSSILGLNENLVKRNIMDAYADNSIAVTDIVRTFPNKVTIYCVEHLPMCAVPKKNDPQVYALADGDFQLNKVVKKEDVNLSELILIEGVEVDDTYNTPNFILIHKLFKALEVEGLNYDAQARFIKTLTFGTGSISLLTRDGYTLTCDYTEGSIENSVHVAYQAYVSTANF